MWETLSGTLLRFVQEWGDFALFLIIFIEESGIPMPLPGDLILIWAGWRAAEGHSSLVMVLLLPELATLLGASILFWLASKGGRPLIHRYGRFLHIDAAKLAKAEEWLGRNATKAIILGRIVPGLRIATPLAAGVFQVPYRTFLPALATGAFIYVAFWVGVGYFFGPSVIGLLHAPRLTARLILSLALLLALGVFEWQIRTKVLPGRRGAAFHIDRNRKIEAAALAGTLSTFEMATAVGALLIGFAELGLDLPDYTLIRSIELLLEGRGTFLRFAFIPMSVVLFFLAGVLWAIAYALWIEPRLRGPDWVKGLTFSVLPTIVSVAIVLPALGAGPLGSNLEAGLVPVWIEILRHAIYGVALGLSYPILLLARRPWHPPPADTPPEPAEPTAVAAGSATG